MEIKGCTWRWRVQFGCSVFFRCFVVHPSKVKRSLFIHPHVFQWSACVRQRATHITLKCCYSEHKWAVIKDRRERLGECAPCTVLAVSPQYSVLTSCGLSGAYEVVEYCYFMGVSLRTGCKALALRSCSTLPKERPRVVPQSGQRALNRPGKFRIKHGDGARYAGSALVFNKNRAHWKQLSLKCVDCLAN